MNAKAWYQSKVIMLLVASIVLGTAAHFGIVLPKSVTQDQIADWLLTYIPVLLAIVARFTSNSVVVATQAKATALNETSQNSPKSA